MSVNRVMLMGVVVRAGAPAVDTEGRPAAAFEIRIDRSYTTPDGHVKEAATLLPVLAVERAVPFGQALSGGESVVVEGRLYCESKKVDGRWHSRSEVVAHRVEVVEVGRGSGPGLERAGQDPGRAPEAPRAQPAGPAAPEAPSLFEKRTDQAPQRRIRSGRGAPEATGAGR